jgi:hypothetical protein
MKSGDLIASPVGPRAADHSKQFNVNERVMQTTQPTTFHGNACCRAMNTPVWGGVGRKSRFGPLRLFIGPLRLLLCFVVFPVLIAGNGSLDAADRTTLFLPLAPDAVSSELGDGLYADTAFGEQASSGWKAYRRLWQAHHENPSAAAIRRFLGLPLNGNFEATARRGRSSPRWLGWKPGSYAQVDTSHFVLYSRADKEESMRVAEDLERCYWVWTQMFFPLWESSAQVSLALRELGDDVSVTDFLESSPQRISTRRKLRVVLCSDADEYRNILGATPGVELSTGFYSDQNQCILLFASDQDDAATRRHELVHQLFREATRSGLGRDTPAGNQGFWLIEGIAGYFESLHIGSAIATVGGWDASRLQFARYRVLVSGDSMSMDELREDGKDAAQARSDIARWYAHAILRTHQLLDRGSPRDRQWVYRQLATQYKIKADVAEFENKLDWDELDRSVRQFLTLDDEHLQANPVSHPLQQLCLAGCEISKTGIGTLPVSSSLQWLDLSRLPIGNEDVRRLVPDPAKMQQLNLEVTRIDSGLADWLRAARDLRELDLSWTGADDEAINALSNAANIATLWMTGTKVSDQSVGKIIAMADLESVDVQRSQITEAGLGRMQNARPGLEVNPLELRTQ